MLYNANVMEVLMLALIDSEEMNISHQADRANDTVHKINQNNQDTTLLNTQRR